jgi:amidohydrolase
MPTPSHRCRATTRRSAHKRHKCHNGAVLDAGLRDEVVRLAKAYDAELIEFRRSLHRHPELGRAERLTTRAIVARLAAAGLSPRVLSTGTGAVCDIVGSAGEPPDLGFRGDLDALPLSDAKDVSYRSLVDGVCHACGHDAHTAIVVGVGLVLADLAKQGALTRSVRLIFQPAEELTPGGALDVIADGALAGLREVYALHCDPRLDAGRVGLRAGPITAGASQVRVDLRGPGGHTARPHLTADLVSALGAVVSDLPTLLSRRTDPRAGLSLVWGQVHAGTAANAIPQGGFAEGTIRSLDVDVWQGADLVVADLAGAIAEPYGVEIEVNVRRSVPPCVNDLEATERLRASVLDLLGPDAVARTEQSLGGEDFAWIVQETPGALARLGVRRQGDQTAPDLHQGAFDIDEKAIGVGLKTLCGLALTA